MVIKIIKSADASIWDQYVQSHPMATLYHLYGWKNVIEKTYGHKTYYLMAVKNSTNHSNSKLKTKNSEFKSSGSVTGILPLVHLNHFIFGNSLISIPFFDMGGILADDEETEKALLNEAIKLGEKFKVDTIELRHTKPLNSNLKTQNLKLFIRSHKVRMLLELPESSEDLMKSFKSKLRSQIKKPIKEGLVSKVGGIELLNDFYEIFLVNMRDLGSPVHSKKIIKNVIEEFFEKARIVIIYKEDQPIACSLIVKFIDALENPWASSLREYSRLSPNMLLYWTMLEYACDQGCKYFDFGRSSPDEGTYRFKEQWGAKPNPLHWHFVSLNGNTIDEETSEKSRFDKAIQYWQKLPVPVTKYIGPMIRKHIGL